MLALAAAFPVFARDVEITIEDNELEMSLEGAVIRSWDGSQYVCDADGKAVISAPDDRQVLIHASYPGYENGRLLIETDTDQYVLGLRLSGIMESRELVLEAERPGTNETKTGRSVAVSGREIAQTAEIGLVEDVMSSIKLLPGVGYAGFFDAMPSIRGGDPRDMTASFDGFYVTNPYFWGGGFSIFDPRIVQSAQLSHGVFSARHSHTISGLLEITSKDPSSTETEFELGINTSAANFNLSVPLAGRGGILFMGRVTYYDPIIGLAKAMSKSIEELEVVNSLRVAPYIRTGTITGNYRFLDNLELKATGFFGMDGVGATYEQDPSEADGFTSGTKAVFDWTNYQAFLTTGLAWNPRNDMLLKLSAGVGWEDALVEGDSQFDISGKSFSNEFKTLYGSFLSGYFDISKPYDYSTKLYMTESNSFVNAQGRIDYDWELGKGFLISAGVQEMFTKASYKSEQKVGVDKLFKEFDTAEQDMMLADMGIDPSNTVLRALLGEYLFVNTPANMKIESGNKVMITSGYGLVEYTSPNNRIGTELGLRVDHYYLIGNDFSASAKPAVNPRFNIDFNIFKNKGIFDSFDITAGTGLFTSTDIVVYGMGKREGAENFKPTRAWTSVAGAKLELPEGILFNIEGYYKYIYDRMYMPISINADSTSINMTTDGEGRSWGIDLMLQKKQSRFWDGWISYSYNWTKYRDPKGANDLGMLGGENGGGWYFPSYHRFHNLNLVVNIKPTERINLYTRFGVASGTPLDKLIGSGPVSYPVWQHDPENGGQFIEQYYWLTEHDENNRTTPSLILDFKISFFGKGKSGKSLYEFYFAIENILGLIYQSKGNTSFNQYTGEKDENVTIGGSPSLPIPIPSFGFKVSY